MSNTLGDKIKKLRKDKGLTLEELAQSVASGKSYIWELENKGVTKPSAEKLNKIASTLGVTPEYLLDEGKGLDDINDAEDQAFFRKYQKVPDNTKKQIQSILNTLWTEDKE